MGIQANNNGSQNAKKSIKSMYIQRNDSRSALKSLRQ